MSRKIIEMKGIVKTYYLGTPNELEILHGIDLDVYDGEFLSIVGASGSGKSTLMNILGALDRPTSGRFFLDHLPMEDVKDEGLSKIRNKKIGFVFQNFNLIPRSSALSNVALPMLYGGKSRSERNLRAKELLKLVGMEDRSHHRPNELSGGQKQRVAIARSMANDPAIILADEPTGALDTHTGRMVMDIFHRLHQEQGKTIILITHNNELALETQRTIKLLDGAIIENRMNGKNQLEGCYESF
ncbi:ABC transporter ATP-binding protein [Acetobacterium bakii]|uniref:Peptide ABC transporter ATP-binding protein n=1 Tax=Acetobacterium bakii TaxID=52689 RepID=A0A0L6TW72_9FIRM|nr:ABC transporter ATP-binding protein [Acetobacterium bakii]KNZ40503.1 peptide ABC transporter ATP-binding protein [Acetobacterium bakii]